MPILQGEFFRLLVFRNRGKDRYGNSKVCIHAMQLVPKSTAMDGLLSLKSSYHMAFVYYLLMLAHVQALGAQMPDLSSCSRGLIVAPPLPRPRWNSQGKPFSLTKGVELRGAACARVSLGREALGAASTNLNMPPDRAPISQAVTPASRREALQLTARRQEIEALIAFKAGIVGGNLSIFDKWNESDPTPCGWNGITCTTSTEQVIGLSLVGHQLEGSVNLALLALGQLHSLRRLDLSNNRFGGCMSGVSLLNLSNLAFMNLSYNQVGGQIPDELGEVTTLQSLAFQFNNLSGKIPPSLCNCTLLTELNLHANLLRGPIPGNIGKLIHLKYFMLGNDIDRNMSSGQFGRLGNRLSGGIPPSLGNCSSLRILDLDVNTGLGGQLPDLSRLRSLQVISCTACYLDGVLPRWLGNLTNLVEIHLAYNSFHGDIPAEIGRLRNLSRIALFYNYNLTGDIPTAIGNCTSLTRFILGESAITGIIPLTFSNCSELRELAIKKNPLMVPAPIPSWLGSLTQLVVIALDGTNRLGEIPSGIGQLPYLNELELGGNALVGSIPPWLSNCSSLEYLELGANNLTGHLPFEISLLSNLRSFTIDSNFLTGRIPSFLTNMTLLYEISVGRNSFGGTIDFNWGLLPDLQAFRFEQNSFVGPIPAALSNCSDLELLHVDDNLLIGDIPTSLGNLSQLRELSVSHNNIKGKIPAALAGCSHLTTLDLSLNRLEGRFPSALGNLAFLTRLNLSHNELTGTIPNSIENLSEVIRLDLSFNRFRGKIPWESLSSLQHVMTINVSHNSLSDSISLSVATLEDVQEIDVSANSISGTIPTLDALRSLQRLDISFNNFSGNIPEYLASLPNLVFFNASYNNLEGPIPGFGKFQSMITAASFLGNSGLCGSVLGQSRECPQNASSSMGEIQCKFFECKYIWISFLVVGVACALLISALVAWAVRSSKTKGEEFDIIVNFQSNFLKFSPVDIFAIIRGEDSAIGITSRSVIYKGLLPGCDGVIAIKTFVGHDNSDTDPRERDLWCDLLAREANLQSQLRHRNILKLLSFCSHGHFRALLFDYMPHGSLYDHLYPHNQRGLQQVADSSIGREDNASRSVRSCELPWRLRLDIAMDIVEGMTYLHHECPEPLIHGDLKPSNILLDEEMVAKVSDFGISKLVNPERTRGELENGEASVSRICGTVGYIPPEYAFLTKVSTKGDVFSLGILLLEMLSGIPPTSISAPEEAGYRNRHLRLFQENPLDILDPFLQREGRTDALKEKQMMLLAKVALFATKGNPQGRPSMKVIRSMLLQIKGLEVIATPRRRTLDELAQEINDLELSRGSLTNEWDNMEPDGGAHAP